MEIVKKQRNSNLILSERVLLIDLVEKYFHIVENKQTDGISQANKNEAWTAICKEFNSKSIVTQRTKENLKSVWENMKKAARRTAAELIKERIMTDGLPVKKLKADPIVERVAGLLGTGSTVLQINVDSDDTSTSVSYVSSLNLKEEPGTISEDPLSVVNSSAIQKTQNVPTPTLAWGSHTPSNLRARDSVNLQAYQTTGEDETVRPEVSRIAVLSQTDGSKLAAKKIEIMEKQIIFVEEEREEGRQRHRLQVQHEELAIEEMKLIIERRKLEVEEVRVRLQKMQEPVCGCKRQK